MLLSTYPKRANGLIKKGRARAIGDDTIMLLHAAATTPQPQRHVVVGDSVPSVLQEKRNTSMTYSSDPQTNENISAQMDNLSEETKTLLFASFQDQLRTQPPAAYGEDIVVKQLMENLNTPLDANSFEEMDMYAETLASRERMLDSLLMHFQSQNAINSKMQATPPPPSSSEAQRAVGEMNQAAFDEKQAYLKAAMEECKQRLDASENHSTLQQQLQAQYTKLQQQYLDGMSITRIDMMDTTDGYNFDDMPHMPMFIKQHINKGFIGFRDVLPHLEKWQGASNPAKAPASDDVIMARLDEIVARIDEHADIYEELCGRIDDIEGRMDEIDE